MPSHSERFKEVSTDNSTFYYVYLKRFITKVLQYKASLNAMQHLYVHLLLRTYSLVMSLDFLMMSQYILNNSSRLKIDCNGKSHVLFVS